MCGSGERAARRWEFIDVSFDWQPEIRSRHKDNDPFSDLFSYLVLVFQALQVDNGSARNFSWPNQAKHDAFKETDAKSERWPYLC